MLESSTEVMFRIAAFPEKTERIIWDQKDTNLFTCLEGETLTVYLVNKSNL